jgi:hypothetical protein
LQHSAIRRVRNYREEGLPYGVPSETNAVHGAGYVDLYAAPRKIANKRAGYRAANPLSARETVT